VSHVKEDFLVVVIDVQLEEVVPRQLINAFFVSLNLILNAHHIRVTVFVERLPELLNLLHVILMGHVNGAVGVLSCSRDGHQVLERFHLLGGHSLRH